MTKPPLNAENVGGLQKIKLGLIGVAACCFTTTFTASRIYLFRWGYFILYINAHLTTFIESQSFGRIVTKIGAEVHKKVSGQVGESKV